MYNLISKYYIKHIWIQHIDISTQIILSYILYERAFQYFIKKV